MKQSVHLRSKELYPGSELVRRYAYKTMRLGEKCALLAKANRLLSQVFAASGAKCALLRKDCFECLSPPNIAA